ncbi:MAG TPA: cupredoxin domain-containing protein [Caulobacteraceae bacterium]|jgi:plastocyanin|nr:cupredoxin domain-containing protein [Caulobacteraceae bacterium]
MRWLGLLALSLAAAGLGAASHHASQPASHAPAVTRKVYSVVIANLAFAPTDLNVRVGDAVQWVNKDMFLHSATSPNHSFDVDLKPNAKAGVVMLRAGVYSYICRYHPGMKGQIVVQP